MLVAMGHISDKEVDYIIWRYHSYHNQEVYNKSVVEKQLDSAFPFQFGYMKKQKYQSPLIEVV